MKNRLVFVNALLCLLLTGYSANALPASRPPQITYTPGEAFLFTGRFEEAAETFRLAIKLQPDYPQARFTPGKHYPRLNNRRGAQEQYEALRKQDAERAKQLEALLRQ
jgi:tetratricopeptide (TPR) repeat protein